MKKLIKKVFVPVLILVLAGILAAVYLYNKKGADLGKTRPDFILTAEELQQAFEADESAASAKYINKVIEVRGIIASVRQGEQNAVSITISTGSPLSSVIGTFPLVNDPSVFREGEELCFRGECSGYLMDVLLNNCALVKR